MKRFDTRSRAWLLLIAATAAVFCAGIIFAPMLEDQGVSAGSWLRLAYRPTCHQMPDRSLDLGCGPLAVCARCSGLYAGGLIALLCGALLGVRTRPRLMWVAVALAPSALDFGLALTGLPHLSNWPRFLVAIPPGLLLGLLLADAIADIVSHVGPTQRPSGTDPLQ